jgi:hypothetical protein
MLSHIPLSSFFVSKIVPPCCCVATALLSFILEQQGEGNNKERVVPSSSSSYTEETLWEMDMTLNISPSWETPLSRSWHHPQPQNLTFWLIVFQNLKLWFCLQKHSKNTHTFLQTFFSTLPQHFPHQIATACTFLRHFSQDLQTHLKFFPANKNKALCFHTNLSKRVFKSLHQTSSP